jgi:hypothetical protein
VFEVLVKKQAVACRLDSTSVAAAKNGCMAELGEAPPTLFYN